MCTRWLSIGRCLERLPHNWDALKVYFKSQHNELEKKHAKKSVKITSSLNASKSADMSDVLKSSDNLETNEQTTTKGKQKSSMPSEEGSALKKTEDMPHDPYAERKVEGIFNFVRSPTNKLYVLFLNYTVHVYDEVLRNLQCEDPKIHVQRRSLHKLLRNILVRFVKPSAMFGKCVDEVQYSVRYNQKANNELVIREACQNFMTT